MCRDSQQCETTWPQPIGISLYKPLCSVISAAPWGGEDHKRDRQPHLVGLAAVDLGDCVSMVADDRLQPFSKMAGAAAISQKWMSFCGKRAFLKHNYGRVIT